MAAVGCALGGSWIVIKGLGFRVRVKWGSKPLIWVITIVTLLLTPRITAHEPQSRCRSRRRQKVELRLTPTASIKTRNLKII